jgi:hypothetical protein
MINFLNEKKTPMVSEYNNLSLITEYFITINVDELKLSKSTISALISTFNKVILKCEKKNRLSLITCIQ